MTAPALLTEAEAAEALRLCPRTLRKARKSGRLTYVLIGSRVRYKQSDLSDFIEAHTMTAPVANRPEPTVKRGASVNGNIVPFSQRAR